MTARRLAVCGFGLAIAGLLLAVLMTGSGEASAASPSEGPSASSSPSVSIVDTGDSRSNGQGPGLVGSPFAIAIGVVLLGVVTAGATFLYLRVIDRP